MSLSLTSYILFTHHYHSATAWNTIPASQCTTGPVQCCDSDGTINDNAVAEALALVDVIVQDPSVLIGLTCTPITVVGVGSGATCNADPLCCENNNFNGIVAIGMRAPLISQILVLILSF
jgi:hypothetical protein